MSTDPLRFGVYVLQDAPLDVLRTRWRQAEDLGFDQLWVADHVRDFRGPGGEWHDGWATLAVAAAETSTARIGMLVSNPVLRPPAVLARLAATVDHFSQGRLELGIGTGIAGFDHEATGTPYWGMRERLDRFGEYVAIVDDLLRRAPAPLDYEGRFYRSHGLALDSPTVQRPRPPLLLGGQSAALLRLVADRADCWNTHGPFGASCEEILEITARQSAQLDRLCAERGRDPASVRRSLLLFGPLDAWQSPDAFVRIVEAFVRIGVTEFVVGWPQEHEAKLFEHAALERLPDLRAGVS